MDKSYSVNTNDWLQATRDLKVSPYIEYWHEKVDPEHPFTKQDFDEALGKLPSKTEP